MINLLPPQYKQALAREENFRLILILGIVFLIFLVVLALILFSVKVHIQGKAGVLETLLKVEEDRLQISEIQELHREIAARNKMISELELFYKTQTDSINTMGEIFQTLPLGVYLTSFSWQKQSAQVTISGVSPSREILFELKNNLEAKDELSDIYFPPQNWIKPIDIDFQATFKVR